MIKKLFFKQLLFVSAALLASSSAIAQPYNIDSPNPTGNDTLAQNGTTPAFVEFGTIEIQNDKLCPIRITGVNSYHMVSQSFQNGANPPVTMYPNVSNQGTTYTLYSSISKLTGSPLPITDGWTMESRRTNVTYPTNGVHPIFRNLNIVVPPLSRIRLLVDCADSMVIGRSGTASTTVNNVTMTVGPGLFWGNLRTNWAVQISGGGYFKGGIVVEDLPPSVSVDFISKPANACIGGSVTLRATSTSPGIVFTWRDKDGNIISQNTTGRVTLNNIQLSDAGRYYVTVGYNDPANACRLESAPDSATLVVHDPVAPTVSGKLHYCLNEQFEPVTVNGTNPKWYYDPVGGTAIPVVPTINTSTPNTLIHYVTQVDAFGCESRERTMVRHSVAPRPVPPVVNTPIYYCTNAIPDQLTAVGDTLNWYYFPNGGVPAEQAPTPNTSVEDSLQFYVTQSVDGCESERSRIDVVVTFRPNGLITADLTNICAKDSVFIGYYGSAAPGSQYLWSFPDAGIKFLTPLDQDTIIVQIDSPGRHTVSLRVGHKGCMSDLYQKDISVSPLPYGKIIAPGDACLGQPILIESREYTPDLDSFLWDFAGGSTAHATTEQGPYGIYWTTPGEKYLEVTFVHRGCKMKAFDTLFVHPKPSAKILATYDILTSNSQTYQTFDYDTATSQICSNDSLKVTVEQVEPGAKYKWSPTRFFSSYSDIPVTYARITHDSKIYVEVEDIYGCRNTDSLKVNTKKCCEMFFPTAFTPNNDGRNDVFRPLTIGYREVESFRVVNRYGQAVYETADPYNNSWDGSFNGQPAELGTYFYQIRFMCDNEKVTQGGEVILIR